MRNNTKLKLVGLEFDSPDARSSLTARGASALDHRNICNIHDIEQTDDGQVFIAMAYYEGATLKERIEQGPLRLSDALDIAIQTAEGLARAHEAGITHRDIKPANIMLTDRGEVKLLDFGLAKLKGAADLRKSFLFGCAGRGDIFGAPVFPLTHLAIMRKHK